jgi:DnaJ-class molecular chaperone
MSEITIDVAYQILGISKDMSNNEIRNVIIKKLKAAHPDHGGTADDFREVYQAVAIVKNKINDTPQPLQTIYTQEGILRSELGKGFNHRNAIICTKCNGTGETIQYYNDYAKCKTCNGFGMISSTGKPMRFQLFADDGYVCPDCKGLGESWIPTKRFVYHVCHACKGIGQIEVLNPVFKDLGNMLGKKE